VQAVDVAGRSIIYVEKAAVAICFRHHSIDLIDIHQDSAVLAIGQDDFEELGH
jgi:hypothetical protein